MKVQKVQSFKLNFVARSALNLHGKNLEYKSYYSVNSKILKILIQTIHGKNLEYKISENSDSDKDNY